MLVLVVFSELLVNIFGINDNKLASCEVRCTHCQAAVSPWITWTGVLDTFLENVGVFKFGEYMHNFGNVFGL